MLPKKAVLGQMSRGFDRASFSKMFNIEGPEPTPVEVPRLHLATISSKEASKVDAENSRRSKSRPKQSTASRKAS